MADVARRHVVLNIPRLLRPLFRRRRELLKELARAGAEAVQELVRLGCGSDSSVSSRFTSLSRTPLHPAGSGNG
jgi:hypothetical protein